MTENFDEKKVFISYCWQNEQTQEIALEIAKKLSEFQSIDVVLDKWELEEGQDKFYFMENSVDTSDFVLILCDKAYKERADNRKGGVGNETTLITPNVYNSHRQNKFIPVMLKKDNEKPCLPLYLESRMGVDMSDRSKFDKGIEKILRIIYGKPEYEKPISGNKIPDFFNDNTKSASTNFTQLNRIIDNIDLSIGSQPRKIRGYIREFMEEFFIQLDNEIVLCEDYEREQDRTTFMIGKIKDTAYFKECFVNVITVLGEFEKLDSEIIIEFLEGFQPYIYSSPEKYKNSNFYEDQFVHFKFLLHELFIYSVMMLMDNKKYNEVNILLDHEYNLDPTSYEFQNFPVISPRLFNWEVKNAPTIHKDLLLERIDKVWRQKYIEIDTFLYIVSKFRNLESEVYYAWCPILSLCRKENKKNRFVEKLKYVDYFSDVKRLFRVNSSKEFYIKHQTIKWNDRIPFDSPVPEIRNFIDNVIEVASR